MKINIKPLSSNQAWRGKKYKTDKYKAYENACLLSLPKMNIPDGELELSITIGVSTAAFDLDNCLKPFIDILQKKYKFNDNRIYSITALKRLVSKGDEFISFDIYECFKTPSWEQRENHCEK